MKISRIRFSAALAGLVLAPLIAQADVGVGVVAGSTGGGVSVTVPVTQIVQVRAQSGSGSLNASVTSGGNTFMGTFKDANQALIVDVHPANSAFVVSAGAFHNGNAISVVGQPQNGTIVINGQTYTSAQAGTVSAAASWSGLVPYLGLGFGPLSRRSGVGLEVGAAFQGAPAVNLSANGTLVNDAQFQQNLAAAREQIRSDLSKFSLFPVVDFRYTFGV